MEQVRHGDILPEPIDVLPEGLKERTDGVIAWGTASGHVHRLVGGKVYEGKDGTIYLDVPEGGAKLIHTEGLSEARTPDHGDIPLDAGYAAIYRAQEYDFFEKVLREVVD